MYDLSLQIGLWLLAVATTVFAISSSIVATCAQAFSNMASFCATALDTSRMTMFAPRRFWMQISMIRCGSQCQIFNAVIYFVVIYMVHMLGGFQCSAEVLLHNKSVFKNVGSIVADQYIATWVHTAATTPRRIVGSNKSRGAADCQQSTAMRAESLMTSRGNDDKRCTTLFTSQRNLVSGLFEFVRTKTTAASGVSSAKRVAADYTFLTALALAQPCRFLLDDTSKRQHGEFSELLTTKFESPMRSAVFTNTFWHEISPYQKLKSVLQAVWQTGGCLTT